MICREGVLLCADSEVSGWPSKTHEEKIDIFDCPYGKVGFVMAGNATLAQSAIEKCRESLTLASPEKAIRRLERILDREYRRQVFQHPNWASDPNLAYWFLVAAWSAEGKIQLYSTQETVLKKGQRISLYRNWRRFSLLPTSINVSPWHQRCGSLVRLPVRTLARQTVYYVLWRHVHIQEHTRQGWERRPFDELPRRIILERDRPVRSGLRGHCSSAVVLDGRHGHGGRALHVESYAEL